MCLNCKQCYVTIDLIEELKRQFSKKAQSRIETENYIPKPEHGCYPNPKSKHELFIGKILSDDEVDSNWIRMEVVSFCPQEINLKFLPCEYYDENNWVDKNKILSFSLHWEHRYYQYRYEPLENYENIIEIIELTYDCDYGWRWRINNEYKTDEDNCYDKDNCDSGF